MNDQQHLRSTIAVIMATYNGEKFLAEQLDSLALQERRPDEIVIVDDASTDSTADIVRRFAERTDVPIHLHVQPSNGGVTATFNEAMARTHADILMFCDQDDVWYPEKIGRVEAVFESHPDALVVINDQCITDNALNRTGHTKLTNLIKNGKTEGDFITGCCTSFRREWRDFIAPVPELARNYDGWVNYPAHLLSVRVVLNECQQLYRRHADTVTRSITSSGNRRALGHRIRRQWHSARQAQENLVWRDAYLSELIDRFEKGAHLLPANAPHASTLASLRAQKAGLGWRIRLLERSRIQRLSAVASHWLADDYRAYSGIKSAVRDLLV